MPEYIILSVCHKLWENIQGIILLEVLRATEYRTKLDKIEDN